MKERCLHRADTSSLLYNYEKFAPQLGRKNYPPIGQKPAYFPTTARLLPKGNELTSQRQRTYFPTTTCLLPKGYKNSSSRKIPHPSHFLPKSLSAKDIQHGRDAFDPSLIPPMSLPPPPQRSIKTIYNLAQSQLFCFRISGTY